MTFLVSMCGQTEIRVVKLVQHSKCASTEAFMFNLLQQYRNRNDSKTVRYFPCLHGVSMSVIPKSSESAQEKELFHNLTSQ